MALHITKMHFTDHERVDKVLVTFSDEVTSSSAVFSLASWTQMETALASHRSNDPIVIEDAS